MISKLQVASRALIAGSLSLAALSAMAQLQVTTYHYDNLRTGCNPKETTLTTANVNPSSFGLLFTLPVDGQVYAQPLYLQNLKIPGKGIHNVVFVCTEHNSVYAFDADSNTGSNASPLWHVNLGPSVQNGDVYSSDINPEIGITSTPVIHTLKNGTKALYLISKTETNPGTSNAVFQNSVHVLNVLTGAELLKGPFPINVQVKGTGDGSVNGLLPFNQQWQQCRPGLLMVDTPERDSTLYVGFASHGDNGPYHGWLLAFDAEKMLQASVLNTTPNALSYNNTSALAAGGIWQGGGGLASDGTSVYFSTGNGAFDPSTKAYGDSILRVLARTYTVADYFTPADQMSLDDSDTDLGAGGVMLLPPSASGTSKKHLIVQSGKEGTIYLMDTSNLGKYGATDNVIQELPGSNGGIWGAPAYFNNRVYVGSMGWNITSYNIQNGLFTSNSYTDNTQTGFGYPGPTPSISSNGSTNGILWAIQTDNYLSGGPAILHAYDAMNLQNELYNNTMTPGRDPLDGSVKFTTPIVVNGKVYVETADSVAVFGLGTWAPNPEITPTSTGLPYTGSLTVSASDADTNAILRYTLDGSTPTSSSPQYTKPLVLTSSAAFRVRAFESGKLASGIVEQDYLINPVIGTGTGLTGWYYSNILNPPPPAGTSPTVTEIDPQINFPNWNGNNPVPNLDPNFGGDNWAAQWNGQVQAESTGTYTFTTVSDDGVQVLINGQMIINDYTYHAPTTDTGTYKFVAGQKYTIQINYMQGGGGSLLTLSWQAPGLAFQIIPTSQLYPAN